MVNHLGVSIDELLGVGPASAPETRPSSTGRRPPCSAPAENPVLEMENGVRWERLAVGEGGRPTRCSSPTSPARPARSREAHAPRRRRVRLHPRGRAHPAARLRHLVLGPGDSLQFDSVRPHLYSNRGSTPARGIWFVVGRREQNQCDARRSPARADVRRRRPAELGGRRAARDGRPVPLSGRRTLRSHAACRSPRLDRRPWRVGPRVDERLDLPGRAVEQRHEGRRRRAVERDHLARRVATSPAASRAAARPRACRREHVRDACRRPCTRGGSTRRAAPRLGLLDADRHDRRARAARRRGPPRGPRGEPLTSKRTSGSIAELARAARRAVLVPRAASSAAPSARASSSRSGVAVDGETRAPVGRRRERDERADAADADDHGVLSRLAGRCGAPRARRSTSAARGPGCRSASPESRDVEQDAGGHDDVAGEAAVDLQSRRAVRRGRGSCGPRRHGLHSPHEMPAPHTTTAPSRERVDARRRPPRRRRRTRARA